MAAGVLLSGLVSGRAFSELNRRISVAVLLQLAAVNAVDFQLEPVEDLDDLLDRLQAGTAAPVDVVQFLQKRLIVPGREDSVPNEKFTDGARRVVVLAQKEAQKLGHQNIATEHLLLGLLAFGAGTAAQVLTGAGVTATDVRRYVEEQAGRGKGHAYRERAERIVELNGLLGENERLHEQVARLRERLRANGLDPD